MKVSNSGQPKLAGINSSSTASVAKSKGSPSKNSTTAAEALGVSVANSAKVDLSSRAQEMKRAQELATAGDGVDSAKIARLQALIDSGQYKADAHAIADKLVDEHLKMGE